MKSATLGMAGSWSSSRLVGTGIGRTRGARGIVIHAGVVVAALAVAAGGCAGAHVDWPEHATLGTALNGDTILSYDVDGTGGRDYVQRMHDGRKTVLYFDHDHDGLTDDEIRLDDADPNWPHYLIVLDGVPHRLAAELWDEGHFRLFRRPSKVISTFPSMTDLALSRLFKTPPCAAIEAAYFDAAANRLRGGSGAYNRGLNSPWLHALTYHAPQSIGAKAYLSPQSVFAKELKEMGDTFDDVSTGPASAYLVGTAGLGTRRGEAAIREYLKIIDRFCERLVYDRRGRVRLTLVADHGHNLTRSKRVGFKRHLAKNGFRLTKSFRRPEDVVTVKYGLVTYAQFFTSRPAHVADALLTHPAVDLVAYAEGAAVVVLNNDGRARISRDEGGYCYSVEQGDPLQIAPFIQALRERGKVSQEGVINDAAFFEAAVDHVYPDALHRLWTCFHDLMQEPPDVIASLRDGYCHGSWLFEAGIGKVASTHGSLNDANSTTFVMSTVGPLPPAMRIEDVPAALGDWRMENPGR